MLPMQSIPLAIEEMRFARKELGMRGGFLRPNPYNGRMLHHPDYAPFWKEVEELDFAIGLHEGASGGMPQVRSEEHTSELQSQSNLVCRLLLEKKKNTSHLSLHTLPDVPDLTSPLA